MINIIEKQSLTDRSSSRFDPISFYVWQIIINQATLFISYIFRAIRLIDISNNNQIKLDQLPNYLKFTLKLPAEEMNDVVEKIIHKLEELLDFKISDANDVHEKARELKDIVIKEHEKFMNSQNNEIESFTKQKIQHNSSRNFNSQNKIDNSTSTSNNRVNNEKSFLQELQYIENQERKLSFKEIVSKPTQPFYQKLSKTQTNILNKINKIASFQDLQFQKVQKIKQIESTILSNLETNYQKLYDSATKFKQLKNKSILKLVLKPIQVQKTNPQQIKQASLTKLIQNKIFATQLHKSYLLKKDTTTNYQINKSASQKKIEQNIKANYLTYEKLEKIKFIQNYFRKYISQKKQVKEQNIITQIPNKKNHYFKIDVNKIRSRSSYTNASQSSRTKTSNLIKLNKQNLQNFLKRQESQGKQSYQDKLVQAKQRKIYQAIDMGDCNLINDSGFVFCKDDFNVKDEERYTPLYYCAKKNNLVVSLYLLQRGANPNTKCLKGQTPTHMACLTQNPDMFNLFQSFGADFNMQDDNGITPQALYKNKTSELKNLNEIPFTSPKFDEFLLF